MIGLHEDFEPTRATLLSLSPLPSLDAVVKELIFKENQRPHHHLSSSDVVLVTPRPPSSSLIDLVAFARTVKNQVMTSLSATVRKRMTRGNNISPVVLFLVHKQPL